MNTLWFVRLYSHPANQWARFLCTAPSSEDAAKQTMDYMEQGWKVRHLSRVCETPETIFMEV